MVLSWRLIMLTTAHSVVEHSIAQQRRLTERPQWWCKIWERQDTRQDGWWWQLETIQVGRCHQCVDCCTFIKKYIMFCLGKFFTSLNVTCANRNKTEMEPFYYVRHHLMQYYFNTNCWCNIKVFHMHLSVCPYMFPQCIALYPYGALKPNIMWRSSYLVSILQTAHIWANTRVVLRVVLL